MIKIYLLQIICLLAFFKCSEQSPLPRDELIGFLNSRLGYYGQRFERIMKTLDPVYANEMRALMDEFDAARESSNLRVKEKLLDNYSKQLSAAFNDELQERLEEQVLNEEILMEQWYFEQMLPYLSPELAKEVSTIIPLFKNAISVKQLDEKYEAFANIEDSYSKELLALLDTEPESKEVMNVHLIFFKEFLQYLLDHGDDEKVGSAKYMDKIGVLLDEVERALQDAKMNPKYAILDRFDSLDDSFGRFLNYKLTEFEVYKFEA